jgi:N-acetylmuramoyl-L-alanine amidase
MANICIDPGHGGKDSGAVAYGRKEKDDVLSLALKIKELLIAQGVSVTMTRSTDKDITIANRTALANKEKCDYFLSLHRDAFSNDSANGSNIYIYSKASDATKKKAQTIYDAVIEASGFRKRGLIMGAANFNDYGVNRDTVMSASVLELGFITSKSDNAIFDSKNDAIAKAITKALCSIVGINYKEKTEPKAPDNNKKVKYIVQAGAFSEKKNAEALVKKLKTAGFDAFINQIDG